MEKLLLLIVILINIIIFNYIYNIEKEQCECSKSYISKFLKYYALGSIVLALYLISGIKYKITKIIYIYSLIGIPNIYLLFKFYQDINKKECRCKKVWGFDFLYYYSMIIMTVYILYCILLMILDTIKH